MTDSPSHHDQTRDVLLRIDAQTLDLTAYVLHDGTPTRTLPAQYDSDTDGLHPAVTPSALRQLLEKFDEIRQGRIEINGSSERAEFLADCLEAVDECLTAVGIPNVNRRKPIYNDQYVLNESFQVPQEYMLPVSDIVERVRVEASQCDIVSENTMDDLEGHLLNSLLNLSIPNLTQTTVKERYIDSRMSAPFGKRFDTYFKSMHERRMPYSLTWAMLSGLSGPSAWQKTFQRIDHDLNMRLKSYIYHRERFRTLAKGELPVGFVDLGKRYLEMPTKAVFKMSASERALGHLLTSRQTRGVDTLFAAIESPELQARLSDSLYLASAIDGVLKKQEERRSY